ncbi:MAG: hypothetical protein WC953_08610 [Pseudomonas sp.]
MPRIPTLALLAALCLPLSALAQSAADSEADDVISAATEQEAEQDAGVLQAELARVEAERQRLADALVSTDNSVQLEQLTAQNLALRDRLTTMEEVAENGRKDAQRKWFIVGGSTVAISLLTGWLLAQVGGRRKRNMWLN